MRHLNQAFEEFELLSRVEVSAIGSVYSALDRRSAQKPVLLWVFDRPGMLASIAMEGLLSAGESPMPNPCLGEFVRCGLHRDTGFAAYEWMPGPSLSEVLQRSVEVGLGMPADLALLTTCEIAAALEATHDGISGETTPHGCLSPHFVLLTDDGPTCVFGFEVAHALLDWDRHHQMPTALSRFVAPEVRDGAVASTNSDAYSLGSILFELLCGEPLPLDTPGQLSALEAEVAADSVPGNIATLIEHSLAEPAERWPDATMWKRRARKIMRINDYRPSGEAQSSFLQELFDKHPVEGARPDDSSNLLLASWISRRNDRI